MPRRREVPKREVLPDPVYSSQLVTKFVNVVMRAGKKTTAQGILYDALDIIKDKTQDDPMKVFKRAIENVKPSVEVNPGRRLALSIRWIIQNASSRGEKSMKQKLAGEFMDAAENRGGAIKKKEDTHRMAEANKAFAHYRW